MMTRMMRMMMINTSEGAGVQIVSGDIIIVVTGLSWWDMSDERDRHHHPYALTLITAMQIIQIKAYDVDQEGKRSCSPGSLRSSQPPS